MPKLPDVIENEKRLEDFITSPSGRLVDSITSIADPLIIIGAGGKMGPTLAVLAKRAADIAGHRLRVIAASRFTNASSRQWLEDRGVETQVVDMFERPQVATLPDAPNVVYLVGMKFGTSSNPSATWAANTIIPMLSCERYAQSKIVALSTGNVYPMSPTDQHGSRESDPLTPLGEYANAAVARERLFGYFSDKNQTPVVLIRLNYAHDLRYGVLTDVAHKVWNQREIDVSMGHFNAIWQGDANEAILRAFDLCSTPAGALNLTSFDIYSVRDIARKFGEQMGREPRLVGQESETALLSDTSLLREKLGDPFVDVDTMIRWITYWTKTGGNTLGKPTNFEVRDGRF